jgi:predicted nucleic acid-binding protein
MKVYLDTSVVLRKLFNEPGQISAWGKWQRAYASRIWLTEALRTVDRIRLEGRIADRDVAQLREELGIINDALYVIPVNEEILSRAGEAFPTTLGTLDAVHLASALMVRAATGLDRFLTHDRRLGLAAKSLGFSVEGVQVNL